MHNQALNQRKMAASAFLSKEWLVEKVYGAEELNLSWKIDVW